MKLQHKLTVVYVITITLPVVLISVFFLNQSRQLILDHISESYEGVLEQQNSNILSKLNFYESVANNVMLVYFIQQILSNPSMIDEEGIPTITDNITKSIGHIQSFSSEIRAIQFYFLKDDIISDGQYLFPLEKLILSLPHMDKLPDSSYWYQEYDATRGKYILSMVKPINSISNYRKVGYIKIIVEPSSVMLSGQQLNMENTNPVTLVADSNGTVVLHPDWRQLGKGVGDELRGIVNKNPTTFDEPLDIDGQKFYLWTKGLSVSGWSSIVLVPEQSVDGQASRFRNLLVLISILCAVLFSFLTFLVTRRLTQGIRSLHLKVSLLGKGLLRPQQTMLLPKGKDEISELDRNFDYMLENLRTLINDNYVEKLRKREIELKFLQAQINPHFLYNTLDSIKNEIDLGEGSNAVEMVVSLANLFRISVSKGGEFIRWEEEIYHAQYYLQIIKIRFGSRYRIIWDIDPEIMQLMTIKIILQPLLENAIRYGLETLNRAGEIRIIGRIEGDIVKIAVIDNGVGITPDQLKNIHNGETGLGLSNVLNRIQMIFGKDFGFVVYSTPGAGTEVQVNLPVVKGDDLYHVQVTDR